MNTFMDVMDNISEKLLAPKKSLEARLAKSALYTSAAGAAAYNTVVKLAEGSIASGVALEVITLVLVGIAEEEISEIYSKFKKYDN